MKRQKHRDMSKSSQWPKLWQYEATKQYWIIANIIKYIFHYIRKYIANKVIKYMYYKMHIYKSILIR